MPRRIALAGVVLVATPVLQTLVEGATALPVGPSRTLTIAVWLCAWSPLVLAGLDRLGAARASGPARAGIALLVPALGLAHLLVGARLHGGPFGPVPGGPLAGPVAEGDRPDWSPARTARYAAIEVRPDRPRSLETLVLVRDDDLYVAANMPAHKRWPAEVRSDGRVRVRVGGEVHARTARPIDDPRESRALLAAMNEKYGFDVSLGGDVWFFRLDPR